MSPLLGVFSRCSPAPPAGRCLRSPAALGGLYGAVPDRHAGARLRVILPFLLSRLVPPSKLWRHPGRAAKCPLDVGLGDDALGSLRCPSSREGGGGVVPAGTDRERGGRRRHQGQPLHCLCKLSQLGNYFIALFLIFASYHQRVALTFYEWVLLPFMTLLSGIGSPSASVDAVGLSLRMAEASAAATTNLMSRP